MSQPGGPKPTIDTTAYSVPIYTVAAGQPTVRVSLDGPPNRALSAAWRRVPVPSEARPAAGSDGDLVVWQPATEHMWEFWRMRKTRGGWQARWGGAIADVSRDQGVYGPRSWPGATRFWGVPATSLALAGGLITLEDLRRGEIDHAVAISIPDARADTWALPAQRSDGTSRSPQALPEGAHLRLDPKLDVAKLAIPHLTMLIAQAAQRYGLVVRDTSPNVGFYAEDPTPTGNDPYSGPGGYFEGRTAEAIAAAFPWSQLELLKMRLRGASTSHG